MKRLKLRFVFLLALLFLGIGNATAQKGSTVMIIGKSGPIESKYEIEIVKPNYEVETKTIKDRESTFYSLMKKEVDIWLNQGYKLTEATANTSGSTSERVLFVLIKED